MIGNNTSYKTPPRGGPTIRPSPENVSRIPLKQVCLLKAEKPFVWFFIFLRTQDMSRFLIKYTII